MNLNCIRIPKTQNPRQMDKLFSSSFGSEFCRVHLSCKKFISHPSILHYLSVFGCGVLMWCNIMLNVQIQKEGVFGLGFFKNLINWGSSIPIEWWKWRGNIPINRMIPKKSVIWCKRFLQVFDLLTVLTWAFELKFNLELIIKLQVEN